MAELDKIALRNKVIATIYPNSNNEIEGVKHQELLLDMIDSFLGFIDDKTSVGLTDYYAPNNYGLGNGSFYAGQLYRANKNTTGVRNPDDWDLVGGSGAWGSITGTIGDQTDLINYLTTNYAPLSNLGNYQLISAKNQANGYAGLDGTGLIPSYLLPSYVDDVLEYPNLAGFPPTGESGKIYVSIATSKAYRWSGSTYFELFPSEVLSVNGLTGIVNLTLANILSSGSLAGVGQDISMRNGDNTFTTTISNNQTTTADRVQYLADVGGTFLMTATGTPLTNNKVLRGNSLGQSVSSSLITDTGFFIGINTALPTYAGTMMEILSDSAASGTKYAIAGFGRGGDASSIGVLGDNLSTSASTSYGVYGDNNSSSSTRIGTGGTSMSSGASNNYGGYFRAANASSENYALFAALGRVKFAEELGIYSSPNANTTFLMTALPTNTWLARWYTSGGSEALTVGASDGNMAVGLLSASARLHVKSVTGTAFQIDGSVISNLFKITNSGIIDMYLQVGNSGLASGQLYKDTAANILANGDYTIGVKN